MAHASSHAASHATPRADLGPANVQLPAAALGLRSIATGIAAVCLVAGAAIGWTGAFGTDAEHFWRAYMVAFLLGLTVCLGALFFVSIQHLTRAGWSVAVRRPAEAIAANLRWIWVLFLPFAALWLMGNANALWMWADMETLRANNPLEAEIVAKKTAYLNPTFFWIRAGVYFAVWALLATFFLRRSVAQDSSGDPALTERMQRVSTVGTILFGLTTSFAAFDWIMSLSPAWFSTMFGVYFFCGCATAGFSAMILLLLRLQSMGALRGIVSPEHMQDLGKMLWAFGMVFWAYIAFSQYMLIWYANVPEETGWFLARQLGGWGPLSFVLLFGHFVIPFVALMSKWQKRRGLVLGLGAAWMLCMHYLDLYWLVVPHVPHDLAEFATYAEAVAKHGDTSTHLANPVNFLLAIGVLAAVAAGTIATLSRAALVPTKDPRLADSLAFENM